MPKHAPKFTKPVAPPSACVATIGPQFAAVSYVIAHALHDVLRPVPRSRYVARAAFWKFDSSCVMSAPEHAPAVFFADFQPISASRSAAVSATFAGHRPPDPPLDDVLPPDDDVLPPLEDVLPPLDEELPPLEDVLPPEDDVLPPDDEPPEDDPPDDDDVFPPDDEPDDLPDDDPPLDDVVGSVEASPSVNVCVTVSAVQATVSAAAEAATMRAVK